MRLVHGMGAQPVRPTVRLCGTMENRLAHGVTMGSECMCHSLHVTQQVWMLTHTICHVCANICKHAHMAGDCVCVCVCVCVCAHVCVCVHVREHVCAQYSLEASFAL